MKVYIRIVMINGISIVSVATQKNLVVKNTMFPQWNFNEYTWISPDRMIHNQIDHLMIDRRWHLSILDLRSFRETNYDTDHYLVVAKLGKVCQ